MEKVIKAGLVAVVNPRSKRQTKLMPFENLYPVIVTDKKRVYTHVKSGKIFTMPVGKSQRAHSIGKRFKGGSSPKRNFNGTYVSEDELIILKERRKNKRPRDSSDSDQDEKNDTMNAVKFVTKKMSATANSPAIFVFDERENEPEANEREKKADLLALSNIQK